MNTIEVVGVSPRPSVEARWLPPLRAVWVGIVAAMCFLWIVGQPTLFHVLEMPCTRDCGTFIGYTSAQWALLRAAGIQPVPYAVVSLIFLNVAMLAWLAVGVVIFARRGTHLGMLVISLAIACTELLISAPQLGVYVFGPALAPLVGIATGVGQVLWYSIFYLFPNGQFVPRWTRWFFLLGVVSEALLVVVPPSTSIGQVMGSVISLAAYPVIFVVAIGAQIYRYRRAATPAQRQQSKWALTGILVTYGCQLAILACSTALGEVVGNVVSTTLIPIVQVAIPLSIGVGILRYRLYDIDLIINRTLVYGSLTALLAGVYFGSVVLLQQVAVAVAGRSEGQNPLILVISTLLIAALFQPLRVRLQRTIDRRFYRQKYDAAKTLAQFAATLRGEVELSDLEQHLVGVVEETMRPAHVSLWLRARTETRGEL